MLSSKVSASARLISLPEPQLASKVMLANDKMMKDVDFLAFMMNRSFCAITIGFEKPSDKRKSTLG
jgi:hypothetical protein